MDDGHQATTRTQRTWLDSRLLGARRTAVIAAVPIGPRRWRIAKPGLRWQKTLGLGSRIMLDGMNAHARVRKVASRARRIRRGG